MSPLVAATARVGLLEDGPVPAQQDAGDPWLDRSYENPNREI